MRAQFRLLCGIAVAAATAIFASPTASRAAVTLTQVSSDPFTNNDPFVQHATEYEPDTYTYGSTVVGVFMVGVVDAVGWATSRDGGVTWQRGFLPITTIAGGRAPNNIADPSVVYDAKAGRWLVATMVNAQSIDVDWSRDGLNWSKPRSVTGRQPYVDKPWITCDNWSTSPHYGNCYVEYEDGSIKVHMSTSTDGGKTWSTPTVPADNPSGLGGQPLVQPSGTVVVPYVGGSDPLGTPYIRSYTSTNGGASWNASVLVSSTMVTSNFYRRGGSDLAALPSAQIDGAGRVYVVWEDCRFRPRCAENDVVMTTTIDGMHWSTVARVPIGSVGGNMDFFLPGIGVDRATSGPSAHLGLYYYFLSDGKCTISTCQEYEGFIDSRDGGNTWGRPTAVTGPMMIDWLDPSKFDWVGEYQGCGFVNGRAFSVFPVAVPPNGNTLNVSMNVVNGGM